MGHQIQRPPRVLAHLQRSTPERFLWCRAKVRSFESEPEPRFILEPKWEFYEAREAYERAQRKHDPLLSPHGFFRSLAHGNNAHAKEFLEKFGPLMARDEKGEQWFLNPLNPLSEASKVYLGYFWQRHLEFCQTMSLWESRNEEKALMAAWRAIAENYPLGHLAFDPADRGGILPWDVANARRFTDPRAWSMDIFDAWARSTSFAAKRTFTLEFVRNQLNVNTWVTVSAIVWESGWERTGEKFRPVIRPETLWAMIWEFFGFDTTGMSWRRCPHCQRLFYPKRRDQFYCTPRQQALASKRAYAARWRAEEKKRRKRPRRARKGATK